MTENQQRAIAREALATLSRDEVKEALKGALGEWLREQLAEVGALTVKGIASMAIAALLWFIWAKSGWKFEP